MFKNKFPGKFIAIEGLDGAGSSTQTNKLKKWLPDSFATNEPSVSVIGGIIKGALSKDLKLASPHALQLLFAADRANHLEKEIIPKLKMGTTVITDRYFFSSLAYGSPDIDDNDWLYQINSQFILPDLTILIKTSAQASMKRIKENRLGIELFETEEKLNKVWETYEQLAKKYPNIKVVDGEKPADEVFEEIKNEVNQIVN